MSFNFTRFSALLYLDFIVYCKSVGLVILTVCLLFALLLFAGATGEPSYGVGHFLFGLLVLGSIFTTSNFMDFRESSDRITYLTLPASNLEKYLTHFLYCIVGFPLAWLLSFWMSVLLANMLIAFFTTDSAYSFFNPFSADVGFTLEMLRYWLLGQGLLFVFSIVFNRLAFVKSIFSILIIVFGFSVICGLIFLLIYGQYLPVINGETDRLAGYIVDNKPTAEAFFNRMIIVQAILTQYVLPPFLFVVAYFKLAEKEL